MVAADDQHIIHGPELLEEIPDGSYGETVYRCLQKMYTLPIAMIDANSRKQVSYKTVFEKTLRLAYSLQRFGISKNEVIAISAENCVNYLYPYFSSLYVGATATLLNPHYTPREIVHVFNITKPSIIFCSINSLPAILKAKNELKFIRKIIMLDGSSKENNVESMDDFILFNSHDYRSFEPVEVDSQSVALILYSSGTTGLPKGVMITHYNLNATFVLFRDHRFSPQRTEGAHISQCIIPFYHAYGFTALTLSLLIGRICLIITNFDKHSYLKTIQDFKLKHLSVVPPIAIFLVNSKLVDKYDLSHVESISTGAAPLSPHIENLLVKKFKKILHVRHGYGLTEATVATVVTPMSLIKTGSVGKLLPKTSAKIVDIHTGKTLGPGEKGEIYFKGPQIMKGYAADVQSTNEVIDEDGWLKTGDIGYYDKDCYFYVVDRLKELIKYKGFQVAPAELEAILVKHPQIQDAAVIGIPDDLAGEVPLAFIVKHPDQNLTEEQVKNFVAGKVTSSKYLRGGVRFIEQIPRNPAGKILRIQLRNLVTQKSKL